ncbi:MAG TPA: hypothetical protein DDW65_22980 [Firmicutes bacterium]|nr:hypothetical protein [Bacillota bacterium]
MKGFPAFSLLRLGTYSYNNHEKYEGMKLSPVKRCLNLHVLHDLHGENNARICFKLTIPLTQVFDCCANLRQPSFYLSPSKGETKCNSISLFDFEGFEDKPSFLPSVEYSVFEGSKMEG